MRVLVIGGGIGGLATARALLLVGLDAVVFERAAELRAVGAGLSLFRNALAALDALGLGDRVRQAGAELTRLETRSVRGDVLARVTAASFGWDDPVIGIGIHRADLAGLLADSLDGVEVCTGAELVDFHEEAGGVVARFADGREERGDLLIGADGLHSRVRAKLHGDVPPRYAGYLAWRGVVTYTDSRFPAGHAWEVHGQGSRFGLVHIDDARVYWFATANRPAGSTDAPMGRKAELLARFGDWFGPIPAVIAATPDDAILRNDVFDRDPLPVWGRGRVTLLGDAAHPMTPDIGQGACQALEDAVVLAAALTEHQPVEAALRAYEAAREARTTPMVRLARRLGRVAQWQHPLAYRLREAATRLAPDAVLARQSAPLFKFEAPTLAARSRST